MALDGTLLRQIRHELEGVLIGARRLRWAAAGAG